MSAIAGILLAIDKGTSDYMYSHLTEADRARACAELLRCAGLPRVAGPSPRRGSRRPPGTCAGSFALDVSGRGPILEGTADSLIGRPGSGR